MRMRIQCVGGILLYLCGAVNRAEPGFMRGFVRVLGAVEAAGAHYRDDAGGEEEEEEGVCIVLGSGSNRNC